MYLNNAMIANKFMTDKEKKEWFKMLKRKKQDPRRFRQLKGKALDQYVNSQIKDVENRTVTREGLEVMDDFWR